MLKENYYILQISIISSLSHWWINFFFYCKWQKLTQTGLGRKGIYQACDWKIQGIHGWLTADSQIMTTELSLLTSLFSLLCVGFLSRKPLNETSRPWLTSYQLSSHREGKWLPLWFQRNLWKFSLAESGTFVPSLPLFKALVWAAPEPLGQEDYPQESEVFVSEEDGMGNEHGNTINVRICFPSLFYAHFQRVNTPHPTP